MGTALLNTVYASAAAGYLAAHHGALAQVMAPVHGYVTGFVCSAAVLAVAMVVSAVLIGASRHDLPATEAVATVG
jgi:hypothetical protein